MSDSTVEKLSYSFHCIPDFRYGLLSMLCPSDVYILLPIVGYRLSEREKDRYMSIDRQVLKSTADIDRLMKQGYSITILGTNLHEAHDLIRGKKKVGDGAWNRRRPCPRNTWTPCYRIKVLICITHPADLSHDELGRTTTQNPDIPVAVPGGTWKLTSRKNAHSPVLEDSDEPEYPDWPDHGFLALNLQTREVEELAHGQVPEKYRTNGISGAQVRVDYPYYRWEEYRGMLGCWNINTDLTEAGFELCHFQRAPEAPDTHEFLCCLDFSLDWDHLKFLDSTVTLREAESVELEYVRLHRRPLELCRTRAPRTDPSLGRGDLKRWDGEGRRQFCLTVVYCDVPQRDTINGPGVIVVRVPI